MNSASLVDELLERCIRFVVQIQFERLTHPDLSVCHNINIGLNGRSCPTFQTLQFSAAKENKDSAT